MDRQALQQAVEDGVLSQAQAEALISRSVEEANSEQLPFVRSFGDVFVTLGVTLVILAGHFLAHGPMLLAVCMAACLAASEFLVKRKRLVLPGIALLLGLLSYLDEWLAFPGGGLGWLIYAAVAAMYYYRYRLPFAVMAVVACLAMAVYQALLSTGVSQQVYLFATVALGMAVFALAMWFDRQDTARVTRLSDTAFWLHLVAAPMMTHGVMLSYITSTQSFGGLLPVMFYLLFAAVALFVDRRALVVSGVAYMIGTVLLNGYRHQVLSVDSTLWFVVVFGVLAVLVGVYWYPLRRSLFGWARHTTLARNVPAFD